MEDLKITIGRNLASLRKKKKLTQIELAEKMGYSDKAISKWEQGATMPDIETMKQLCDFYGVTLDYLTKEENIFNPQIDNRKEKILLINHVVITSLLASIVWMIATIIFVYPLLFQGVKKSYWPSFLWAIPATCLVLIISNFIYFKRNKVFTFVSLTVLIWSLLTSVFLHYMFFSDQRTRLWLIFILGIPAQIILILWFLLKKVKL